MVSVIIVAYNRLDLVKKCLSCAANCRDCEVILVDNNSSEDVIGFVEKNYPEVKIIANKRNYGFARGNNLGMKAAKGDYFLLLNTDAFLENGTLDKLVDFAQKHSDLGAVGPKLLNADGSLQPSAGHFPSLWTVFLIMTVLDNLPLLKIIAPSIHVRYSPAFAKTHTFGWVTGACLLVPRNVFEKTNGFDENYFMYGEELEWQYRMKKLGYKSYYLPAARATHLGYSSSSPTNGAIKELQSYIAFFRKYKPAWQIPLVKMFIFFGCFLRICRGLVQPKHRWMFSAYLSAAHQLFKI